MLSNILGFVGVLIGALGLVYAWYANRERVKVEKFIRAAGWDLYNKVSNENAYVQMVSDLLIDENIDKLKVISQISKADAFGQYILRDTAKIIHHVEAKFEEDLVNKWVESERIFSSHKEVFMALTPSSNIKLKHRTEKVDEIIDISE